ncbi:MAG: ABC transporter ATP-binding protein, partial [Thermomicrobiales bacterium]|nr:ABC transporter ATP-binding protein [Thermomicrobiales bacterium]
MSHEQRSVALRCERVHKTFGETTVVDRLDLDVASGEICALLGPSGCGKTTTLRLIAGFEQPDSGAIAIGGRVVAQGGRGQAWALPPEQRRVGMVFQDYALFPHLSVRDNVGFGLERKHRQRADDMLALVGMDALGDRMPGQLSGGQQQRVALAR